MLIWTLNVVGIDYNHVDIDLKCGWHWLQPSWPEDLSG